MDADDVAVQNAALGSLLSAIISLTLRFFFVFSLFTLQRPKLLKAEAECQTENKQQFRGDQLFTRHDTSPLACDCCRRIKRLLTKAN